jgi:xanthine dehydrogenase YagS FAD-binding subunit
MKDFEYVNPPDTRSAVAALTAAGARGKLLAGGIDLLGEMKDYIRTPDIVVNLKAVSGLDGMRDAVHGLEIGALVRLADIAANSAINGRYTALAEAATSVGTPQIRNVGTLGGNLCQRPRCWYYRDEQVICLKKGGTRCYAVDGENQYHAIIAGGPSYIVHPSDCAPALIALNATVTITGPKGARTVPLENFFVLPTETLVAENVLQPNEIVTHVTVPAPPATARSHYLKIRHRESFDWALAGAAVMLAMDGKKVRDCRVVLSGVAPIPWRSHEAEAVLRGATLTSALADRAGAAAVSTAKPMAKNAYKVPLTRNTVKLAVLHAGGMNG